MSDANPPAPSRPPLSRWTVPVVAAVVLVTSGVVLWALWRWIDGLALADAGKRAAAQLDAVKTASGIAIGGGGLFALYLAARRQRTQELELAQRERAQAHTEQVAESNRQHAERVAAAAEDDAAARRVTELYTKASEQLGSDKAPVRLAGLYALERLAQENPDQRQTVVNLLCAYLRMPYTLPGDEEDQALRDARRQEREVRLTAQRILATHLRDAGDSHWADMDLDLSGGLLIGLDLSFCHVHGATFAGASFTGDADFTRTTFTGDADFSGASFTDDGWFIEASFDGNADFAQASFAARASFRGTSIAGDALFDAVSFDGSADFEAAELTGVSSFVGASLPEHALKALCASAGARSFRG
ncbi:pentapeptide repeat-containing protein [Actinosynnema sp. NPDC051121]